MEYMNKKTIKTGLAGLLFLAVLFTTAFLPLLARHASAATMTQTFVRFDRMTTSTFTSGTVCAMSPTAASATETSVKVTFPTGYTVSGTAGNWTVSTATTTGWPTGGTAWTGISAPTGSGEFVISGQAVNFVSGNLASASTLYCFNWTNTSAALQTKSSATNDNTGTVITQTTGGAASDTGSYATATVTNDSINVTATVNPSFQMSFSGGNTDALGVLTTGAVASSATTTMTVNTNAKNGWLAWAKDSSTGLNSPSASYTIASTGVGSASQALVAGTEGYNTGIAYSQTSGSCTAGSAVNANFDKAGGSNKGGGLDTTLRTLLTCGGTTNAGVITPTVFAAINGATAAASDYTDTQTYVAAGLF